MLYIEQSTEKGIEKNIALYTVQHNNRVWIIVFARQNDSFGILFAQL